MLDRIYIKINGLRTGSDGDIEAIEYKGEFYVYLSEILANVSLSRPVFSSDYLGASLSIKELNELAKRYRSERVTRLEDALIYLACRLPKVRAEFLDARLVALRLSDRSVIDLVNLSDSLAKTLALVRGSLTYRARYLPYKLVLGEEEEEEELTEPVGGITNELRIRRASGSTAYSFNLVKLAGDLYVSEQELREASERSLSCVKRNISPASCLSLSDRTLGASTRSELLQSIRRLDLHHNAVFIRLDSAVSFIFNHSRNDNDVKWGLFNGYYSRLLIEPRRIIETERFVFNKLRASGASGRNNDER